jgi:hypothetical protein
MLCFLRARARVRPARPAPIIATEGGGERRDDDDFVGKDIWSFVDDLV